MHSILYLFIFLSLFSARGYCAEDKIWEIKPSRTPFGAFIYKLDSALKTGPKPTGWIGENLSRNLLNKNIKFADLSKLASKEKDISAYTAEGVIRLTYSDSAALKLNEEVQKEWTDAEKNRVGGKKKCWFINPLTKQQAPSVLFAVGWVDPFNPAALKNYQEQSCSGLKDRYYSDKGPSQVCVATIACKDSEKPQVCFCKPVKNSRYDIETTGNPKEMGKCPSADECLAQCDSNSLPGLGKIEKDSNPGGPNDAAFEKYVTDEDAPNSSEQPLVLRGAGKAGICLYRHLTKRATSGSAICVTTDDHCPSAKACVGSGCVGYMLGHY